MKYKVTLNQKVYEVEVEAGKAVLRLLLLPQKLLRLPLLLLHRLRRQR